MVISAIRFRSLALSAGAVPLHSNGRPEPERPTGAPDLSQPGFIPSFVADPLVNADQALGLLAVTRGAGQPSKRKGKFGAQAHIDFLTDTPQSACRKLAADIAKTSPLCNTIERNIAKGWTLHYRLLD